MDNVHLPLSLAGCARRERKLKMLDDEQIALKERNVLVQAKYCAWSMHCPLDCRLVNKKIKRPTFSLFTVFI